MKQLRHLPSGCLPNQIDLVAASSTHLAYSSSKCTYIFEPEKLTFSQVAVAHDKPITSLSFSPLSPTTFVTTGLDSKIIQWSAGSHTPHIDGNLATQEIVISLPDIPIYSEYSPTEPNIVAVLQRNGRVLIVNTNVNTVTEPGSPVPSGNSSSRKKESREHSRTNVFHNDKTGTSSGTGSGNNSTNSASSNTNTGGNNTMMDKNGNVDKSGTLPPWGEVLPNWSNIHFFAHTTTDFITCIRWSPNSQQFLLLGNDQGSIYVCSRAGIVTTLVPPPELDGVAPRDIVFPSHTNTNLVLALYGTSNLVLYDISKSSIVCVYRPQPTFINAICFIPNTCYFVTCSDNNRDIVVWSIYQDIPIDIFNLSYLHTDISIANIFLENTISDVATVTPPMYEMDLVQTLNSIQEKLYITLSDGSIHRILFPSLVEISSTNISHSNSIYAMEYHPTHAHILATASYDGTVRIWDTNTLTTQVCIQSKETVSHFTQPLSVNFKACQYNISEIYDTLLHFPENSTSGSNGGNTTTDVFTSTINMHHPITNTHANHTTSSRSKSNNVRSRLGYRTGSIGSHILSKDTSSFSSTFSVQAAKSGFHPYIPVSDEVEQKVSEQQQQQQQQQLSKTNPLSMSMNLTSLETQDTHTIAPVVPVSVNSVAWHPTLPYLMVGNSTGNVIIYDVNNSCLALSNTNNNATNNNTTSSTNTNTNTTTNTGSTTKHGQTTPSGNKPSNNTGKYGGTNASSTTSTPSTSNTSTNNNTTTTTTTNSLVPPSVLARLPVHTDTCVQAEFLRDNTNPDLYHILSIGGNTYVTITSVEGVVLARLPHPMNVLHFSMCPSVPDLLAVACADGKIYFWDLSLPYSKISQPSIILKGHTGAVYYISWSSTVRGLLASASEDQTIRIWDVLQGGCVKTLLGHTNTVRALSWNTELPHILVSGSSDSSVRIWDVRDGKCLMSSVYHYQDVYCIAYHAKYPFLYYTSGRDGSIREWNLGTYLLRMLKSKLTFQGKLDTSFLSTPIHVLKEQPTPGMLLCGAVSSSIVVDDNGLSNHEQDITNLPNVATMYAFFDGPQHTQCLFQLASKLDNPTLSLDVFVNNSMNPALLLRTLSKRAIHVNDLRAIMWTKARNIMNTIVPNNMSNNLVYYNSVHNAHTNANETNASIGGGSGSGSGSTNASTSGSTTTTTTTTRTHKSRHKVVEIEPPSEPKICFPAPAPIQITDPKKREKLSYAGDLFLQLGNLYEYCQIQIMLGNWERALGLAPSVTNAYWKQVLHQYTEHLQSKKAPNTLPYLLASGDITKYSTFLKQHQQAQTSAVHTKNTLTSTNMLTSQHKPVECMYTNTNTTSTSLVHSATTTNNANVKYTSKGEYLRVQDPLQIMIAEHLGATPMSLFADPMVLKADEQELVEYLKAEEEREANDYKLYDIGVSASMSTCVQATVEDFLAQSDYISAACQYLSINDLDNAIKTLIEGDEMNLAISLSLGLHHVNIDYVWRLASARYEALGLYDEALECIQQISDIKIEEIILLCSRYTGPKNRQQDLYSKAGLKTPQEYIIEGTNLLTSLREPSVNTKTKGRGRPLMSTSTTSASSSYSSGSSSGNNANGANNNANTPELHESYAQRIQIATYLLGGNRYNDVAILVCHWLYDCMSKPTWSSRETEGYINCLRSVQLDNLSPALKYLVLAHIMFNAGIRAMLLGYTSITPYLFHSTTRALQMLQEVSHTSNNTHTNNTSTNHATTTSSMIMSGSGGHSTTNTNTNNTNTSSSFVIPHGQENETLVLDFPVPCYVRNTILALGIATVDPVTAYTMCNQVLADPSIPTNSKIKNTIQTCKKAIETNPKVNTSLLPCSQEEERTSTGSSLYRAKSPLTSTSTSTSTSGGNNTSANHPTSTLANVNTNTSDVRGGYNTTSTSASNETRPSTCTWNHYTVVNETGTLALGTTSVYTNTPVLQFNPQGSIHPGPYAMPYFASHFAPVVGCVTHESVVAPMKPTSTSPSDLFGNTISAKALQQSLCKTNVLAMNNIGETYHLQNYGQYTCIGFGMNTDSPHVQYKRKTIPSKNTNNYPFAMMTNSSSSSTNNTNTSASFMFGNAQTSPTNGNNTTSTTSASRPITALLPQNTPPPNVMGNPNNTPPREYLVSAITGKYISNNPVVLEDGMSVISRTEALMLRQVTPFTPLLNGERFNLA